MVVKGAGGTGNPIERAGSRAMLPAGGSGEQPGHAAAAAASPGGGVDGAAHSIDAWPMDTRLQTVYGVFQESCPPHGTPLTVGLQPNHAVAAQLAAGLRRPGGPAHPLLLAGWTEACAAWCEQQAYYNAHMQLSWPQVFDLLLGWQVGQEVEASFHGEWYRAVILEVAHDQRCPRDMPLGGYVVQWEEDQSFTLVHPGEVRPPGLLLPPPEAGAGIAVGEPVEVMWHGAWHPGTVCGTKPGDVYNIDWGDGTGSHGIRGADLRRPGAAGAGGGEGSPPPAAADAGPSGGGVESAGWYATVDPAAAAAADDIPAE